METTLPLLHSLVPAGISAPALFWAREITVTFTTGASLLSRIPASRESMASEPACMACGFDAPPKRSIREVAIYLALAKLNAGRTINYGRLSTSSLEGWSSYPSKI